MEISLMSVRKILNYTTVVNFTFYIYLLTLENYKGYANNSHPTFPKVKTLFVDYG